MKCSLCEKEIGKYDARFHHLPIDDCHSADFCPECIDKFAKWQSKLLAVLFPTMAMKKIFSGKG